MSNEIIVLALPYSVFAQTDTYTLAPGGTAGGVGIALAQLVLDDLNAKEVVKIDEDSESEEIVVVAQKIKTDLTQMAVLATANSQGGWGARVNLPCVGQTAYAEIAGNLKNMTFQLGSTDYGPGRAGENLVGSDGVNVPIQMNAEAALDYSNLTNGIAYLISHEIAHSLYAMQQYNNQQWTNFADRYPTLTQAQLKAAYPDSPEFTANEARANTVARAIASALGFGAMSPDPEHGYQVC